MTYRLIYESQSAEAMTDDELRMIAMFSALWNRQHGIAGLLLHHNGRILQVLEGPQDAVKLLFKKISRDQRHHSIELLYSNPCREPVFDDWSMGYRPMENDKDIDVFFELSKENLNTIAERTSSGIVKETLRHFQDKVRLDS